MDQDPKSRENAGPITSAVAEYEWNTVGFGVDLSSLFQKAIREVGTYVGL